MQAGQRYDIVLEYFNDTGADQMRLSRSSASNFYAGGVVPTSQLYPSSIPPYGMTIDYVYEPLYRLK
jgi:hypothetical protein